MESTTNKLTRDEVREIDQHVGRRLRQRRIMMDYSQTFLAEQVGLSFQQFQKYEKGANRISASKLHEFAQILDVPVSYFFEEMPTKIKAASQATDPAIEEDENPFTEPEVREFVQAYQKVTSPNLRKSIFQAVKAVAKSSAG